MTSIALFSYHPWTMIARIEGILDTIAEGSALVRTQTGLSYEVLLPAYVVGRLGGSVGEKITLHTLYFIEGQAQGTTMTPRLAGFTSTEDRRFFELFTTCKGIGNRRALRSMTLETSQIATAIADRDVALLQSLPEIGKRTAETIIATLRGKVDAYVSATAYDGSEREAGSRGGDGPRSSQSAALSSMAREALEVLLQLGENRVQTMTWIDEVLRQDDPPRDTQDLITRAYHVKTGG